MMKVIQAWNIAGYESKRAQNKRAMEEKQQMEKRQKARENARKRYLFKAF